MGILSRIFERRDMSPADPRAWGGVGLDTSSGVRVDHDRAIGLAEVYAAFRAVSEDLGALPLPAYARQQDGSRRRADEHWIAELVDDQPNPLMSSQEWRESMQGQAELRGNSYSEIERNGAGRPLALWPLRTDRTEPFVGAQGGLYYRIGHSGRQAGAGGVILPARNVLHLRGFSSNGLIGYDPIQVHREGIGHALALQEFGSRFFGNGSRPGGILTHPGRLKDDTKKKMRESWELAHKGLAQSHRVAILEEGVKWEAVGFSPEAGQYIESKKLKASDAAKIWRIPPHIIGDLDRATFSNIEQQALEYVIYSLLPRAKRFEKRIRLSLLDDRERRTVFVEHLFEGLLRGDVKARYEAYALARQWGWMCVDDIRRLENMSPLPNGQGQIYISPMNMMPADQVGQDQPAAARATQLVAQLGRNGHQATE